MNTINTSSKLTASVGEKEEDSRASSMLQMNEIRGEDLKLQTLIKEYKHPPLPLPKNIVARLIAEKD
jgi:hypothetical protein